MQLYRRVFEYTTFNPLNPTFPHLKALRPEISSQKLKKKSFSFFFRFGIMNRLQLSNQFQNQCNNIEIAFAGADMILIVHFHVWPEIRPLGFKGLNFCT